MIENVIKDLLAQVNIPATIGDLPGNRDNAVAIIAFDGPGNLEYFGGKSDSTIYQPTVKIVVRHSSYEVATQWLETIKDTLHRYNNESVLSIFLVGTPMYLGKSPQKLHEFQIVFSIKIKE